MLVKIAIDQVLVEEAKQAREDKAGERGIVRCETILAALTSRGKLHIKAPEPIITDAIKEREKWPALGLLDRYLISFVVREGL